MMRKMLRKLHDRVHLDRMVKAQADADFLNRENREYLAIARKLWIGDGVDPWEPNPCWPGDIKPGDTHTVMMDGNRAIRYVITRVDTIGAYGTREEIKL